MKINSKRIVTKKLQTKKLKIHIKLMENIYHITKLIQTCPYVDNCRLNLVV